MATALSVDALAAIVGLDDFEAACRGAHQSNNAGDLPHEFADRLWYDGEEPLAARLAVAVDLYRRMPCYGNVMYWKHRYREFDERTRDAMWSAYRSLLSEPAKALAQPATYSLFCDWFEDRDTVERAWAEVAGLEEPRRPRLERVVPVSGPVPWELKEELYRALAPDPSWQRAIVEGLLGSCFDIYGSLDRWAAGEILERVNVPAGDREVDRLRAALADPRLPKHGADRWKYVLSHSRDNGGKGKYRLRTWLRRNLPHFVADRIPKGSADCGNHEWYNADNVVERCYHCTVGIRTRVPPAAS